MKAYWEKIAGKVDALSLRERALIFAAAAFVVVSLMDTLLLSPLLAEQRRLSSQAVQQQERLKDIRAQLTELIQAKQADQDAPQRERIRLLREQITQGDAFLKQTQDKLVAPQRMAGLLEQVLARNGRLQLVALETLPVTNFVDQPAAGTTPAHAGRQIYKHGVRITVRGSYADLTAYLRMLESLPTQMFWGMARLDVVKYPQTDLTLELYTLSLDETWLQV
ncbi:MAG: agglutinin biogenesis protein [Pseudomonadota bacterium]